MKSNMMRNLKKRALALLLCSAMVLNSGVTTFAEENSGKVPEVPNATEYQCGFEEHEHEDACYSKELLCTENAEPVLTCVVEAHEHEEACYEEPVLKCEKTEHKHGGACYTAHEHGEDCYTLTCTESTEPVLVCTTEVYAHTDSCYTAHVHGEGCYGSELTCETPEKTLTCTAADCTHEDAGCYTTHSHGEGCYTSVVTCTESTDPVLVCEKAEHKHGDACYTAHVHGEGCYTVTCTESTEPVLVCTTEEYVHTEACYEEPVLKCEKTEHVHDEEACYIVEHVHEAACYTEPVLICEKTVHTHTDECKKTEPVLLMNVNEGNESWSWDEETTTLTLKGGEVTELSEKLPLPDGTTIVLEKDASIAGGDKNAITCEGALTIKGSGELTLTGYHGITATSVTIEGIDVDINATSFGINVTNKNGNSSVTLKNVDGTIIGGYRGISAVGTYTEGDVSVEIENCDLDLTSTTNKYSGTALNSGITVFVQDADKMECRVEISDSKIDTTGYSAGISVNNYTNNSRSSYIDITNSEVTANAVDGTWSGIFASVSGKNEEAHAIITIKDSSVYAVSPNTGILTSSQQGESRIILDNSILGASGKTALSMIEKDAKVKEATLKNGSTYVQMTPAAIMKGTLNIEDGKTIVATAGDGITYDAENNYYVIPQGSEVKETFTNGKETEYTFENQAGGIGGFDYAKEEIWGYDRNHVCEIVETGVKYKTLAAAIADANVSEGADTIRMLMSIDFDTDYMKKNQSAKKVDALSITGDVTIIGDYTISRGEYAGTLFKVPAGASLTLDGGLTIDGNNNWTFNEELYNHNLMNMVRGTNWNDYITPEENGTVANAAMFMVNGTVNAKDMSIKNTYSLNSGHPLFYVKGAIAVLNMEGAQVVHCANKASNTVAYMSGSKWYIKEDTVISENYGGGNGGMCRNDSGQIYMSGGIIKDNKGHNANGSVFMMYGGGSQLIMSGGTICHNSSVIGPDNGRNAAVYLHSSSYVKMTGGTICCNIGTGRGGIDSYKKNSILDINRVDQEFDNPEWKESEAAAYTASNHPMVIDNVSLANSGSHDVGHSYNFDTWWVTGGIYTQDVDDFCAEGYVCIPYEDSERTDDYIVVPGYRVRYHAVEKIVTLDAEGNENIEYNTTLVKKEFLELLRDEFWYNQDEYAEFITYTDEETGKIIDTWYTEKELLNVYDFANTELLDNLDVYGRYNPRYGYVVIEKDLENYNATMKGSTFVYEVTAKKYGDPYYKFNEAVAIEMDGTSGKYVQVGPILEDAEVTVTEIYSGAGYTKAEQSQTQTVVYSKENKTPVKIVFTGSYIPGRINYGTSVIATVKKENEI